MLMEHSRKGSRGGRGRVGHDCYDTVGKLGLFNFSFHWKGYLMLTSLACAACPAGAPVCYVSLLNVAVMLGGAVLMVLAVRFFTRRAAK